MKIFRLLSKTVSILILLAVLILCLPVSVPRLLGYDIFNIVSGSMEPTIPVGSAVYSKNISPTEISSGDIIVFKVNGSDTPITHRVLENRTDEQMFITKGDANKTEDIFGVPWDCVLGKMSFSIPLLGMAATVVSSSDGKISVCLLLAAALVFFILGSSRKNDESSVDKESGKDKSKILLYAGLGLVLASVLVFAGYRFFALSAKYIGGAAAYDNLDQFLIKNEASSEIKQTSEAEADYFPWEIDWPEIDFDELKKQNSDVIAWIYLEDGEISYPVVSTKDNEYYLSHDLNGRSNVYGCIFLDMRCEHDFTSCNSILYGHNMADKSMFAKLDRYKDKDYIKDHPIGLLITPDQNYVLEFYTGYPTEAYSETWAVDFHSKEDYEDWIAMTKENSLFDTDVDPDALDHIVTLCTCTYEFYDARFALQAVLRPEPKHE